MGPSQNIVRFREICFTALVKSEKSRKMLLSSQVKNEGYDGREASKDDDMEPSQWNLPGSLLYSVTIITTIGNQNQEPAILDL